MLRQKLASSYSFSRTALNRVHNSNKNTTSPAHCTPSSKSYFKLLSSLALHGQFISTHQFDAGSSITPGQHISFQVWYNATMVISWRIARGGLKRHSYKPETPENPAFSRLLAEQTRSVLHRAAPPKAQSDSRKIWNDSDTPPFEDS